MLAGAEFFTAVGPLNTIRLSVLRVAKYSGSPIEYFMTMPIGDFYEWVKVVNEEVKRENKEIEKGGE